MRKKLTVILTTLFLFTALSLFMPKQVKAESIYNIIDNIEHVHASSHYVFWSNQPGVLDAYLPGCTTEKYDPATRRWVGISYVAKTACGRIWVSYMTGGFLEPDNLNYAVIQYSDDDGKTWSEDFIIIERDDADARLYSPILFYDNSKLSVFMNGYLMIIDNPDCEKPSENIHIPKNFYYTGYSWAHAPTKINEHYYIGTVENASTPTDIRIVASANGIVWEDIAKAYSIGGAAKKWNEGQIAVLSDGKYMMLGRLDGGTGVERTYSDDDGYTWSGCETDLESPYVGPFTRLGLINTNDGGLLIINNDSTERREKMTCWLSYDDGQTWPYKYVIDDREWGDSYWGISYPDAKCDDDGNIYITWDQRTPFGEINVCKLSVEDIKAGKIVTEGSYKFTNVTRCVTSYEYITAINEELNYMRTVEVGTTLDSITENLPTEITYRTEKGAIVNATGTWKSDDYRKDEAGYYTVYFDIDNMNPNHLDPNALLRIRIKSISQTQPDNPSDSGNNNNNNNNNEGENKAGCTGSITSVLSYFIFIPLTLYAFKKRKDNY